MAKIILPRERSPSFPFISLEKAIARAEAFYREYSKHPARIQNAVNVWKYNPKSSGGKRTIAALKAFGLLVDIGSAGDKKVKLTEIAIQIIADKRPGKREEAIRLAALMPKAFKDHWDVWGTKRPPDQECISELSIEKGFTTGAAEKFIKVYDETIHYVGLTENDTLSEIDEDSSLISSNENAGNKGGVSFLPPPSKEKNMSQDTFTLDEGQVVLQWPKDMSEDNYEDFEAWLNLMMKKIKRSVKNPSKELEES